MFFKALGKLRLEPFSTEPNESAIAMMEVGFAIGSLCYLGCAKKLLYALEWGYGEVFTEEYIITVREKATDCYSLTHKEVFTIQNKDLYPSLNHLIESDFFSDAC